jgi:hypothetical protein
MKKIQLLCIAGFFLLSSCVNELTSKKNLESTLVLYQNAWNNKDFKSVVGFMPDEVVDEIVSQSSLKISREELKEDIVEVLHKNFKDSDLNITFSDIGKMSQHSGNVFFTVRGELSGEVYSEKEEKSYRVLSNGFVIGISIDKGRTFQLVGYENENTKAILEKVYGFDLFSLDISYPIESTEEIILK